MNRLLSKILRGKKSNWEFALAGLGFFMGLLMIMLSIQVFMQIQHFLNPAKDNSPSGDYLIINKEISLANTLQLSSSHFEQKEIDTITAKPFVKKVGAFRQAAFAASASTNFGINFNTAMFFESVPDEYIDDLPQEWQWYEGSNFLPIIVSQDFLNLYNFGFAPSQGLPQLSRAAFKMVPLQVTLVGAKGTKTYTAKIVSFSDRIPSVLVPDKFLQWANKSIGSSDSKPPARLMLQVQDISDPEIEKFIKRKGYVVGGERLRISKAGGTLRAIVGLVALMGLMFIAVAVLAFTTNFRAIVAESKEEIALLIQLGYATKTIATNLTLWFGGFVFLIGIVCDLVFRYLNSRLHNYLADKGIFNFLESYWVAEISCLAVLFIALATNTFSVFRLIRRCYR